MKEVSQTELKQIQGGAISLGAGLLIVGGVIFIAGIIDGYVRPLTCNS